MEFRSTTPVAPFRISWSRGSAVDFHSSGGASKGCSPPRPAQTASARAAETRGTHLFADRFAGGVVPFHPSRYFAGAEDPTDSRCHSGFRFRNRTICATVTSLPSDSQPGRLRRRGHRFRPFNSHGHRASDRRGRPGIRTWTSDRSTPGRTHPDPQPGLAGRRHRQAGRSGPVPVVDPHLCTIGQRGLEHQGDGRRLRQRGPTVAGP